MAKASKENIKGALLREKIAERLKTLRKERGLSQSEVLNNTEIKIDRIESGQVNVTVRTVQKLCEYFQISLTEFFQGF